MSFRYKSYHGEAKDRGVGGAVRIREIASAHGRRGDGEGGNIFFGSVNGKRPKWEVREIARKDFFFQAFSRSNGFTPRGQRSVTQGDSKPCHATPLSRQEGRNTESRYIP